MWVCGILSGASLSSKTSDHLFYDRVVAELAYRRELYFATLREALDSLSRVFSLAGKSVPMGITESNTESFMRMHQTEVLWAFGKVPKEVSPLI